MNHFRSEIFSFSLLLLSSLALYRFTEGQFINPDSFGYLAYIPSLIQGTVSFSSTFEKLGLSIPMAVTQTGYAANVWQAGTALFWFPFYRLHDLFTFINVIPHSAGDLLIHVFFINFGSYVYGILTLIIIYQTLDHFNFRKNRGIVIASVLFGSPLFYYMTVGAAMPHAISAFITALFCWVVLNFPERQYLLHAFSAGVVGGVMTMVRPESGAYLFLLFLKPAQFFRPFSLNYGRWVKYIALAALGCGIGFLPQILFWQKIYGHPFAFPQFFNVAGTPFYIGRLLFSSYHGLLVWTPVLLLGGVGYFFAKGEKKVDILFLGIAYAVQILIKSKAIGWWNGYSFGIRRLTDSALPIAVGLACLSHHRHKSVRISAIVIMILSSLWTLGLFLNHVRGTLSLYSYESFSELWTIQKELFLHPLDLFRVLLFSKPPAKPYIWIFWGLQLLILLLIKWKWKKPAFTNKAWAVSFTAVFISFLILTVRAYGGSDKSGPFRERQTAFLSEKELDDFLILHDLNIEVAYLNATGRRDESNRLRQKLVDQYQGTRAWDELLKRMSLN